jgi:thiamine biosynthesis protein ThiS
VVVNGARYEWRDGLTLHALLADLKVEPRAVAVMHGDRVYKRGAVPDAPLNAQDVLEVVTMMQGG